VERTKRIERLISLLLSENAVATSVLRATAINGANEYRIPATITETGELLLIQADDIAARGLACLVAHVEDPGEQHRPQQVNIFA